MLLMELWRDPTCAGSLTAAAQAGGPLFADFVGAVLNDLVHLLKDSLAVGAGAAAAAAVPVPVPAAAGAMGRGRLWG